MNSNFMAHDTITIDIPHTPDIVPVLVAAKQLCNSLEKSVEVQMTLSPSMSLTDVQQYGTVVWAIHFDKAMKIAVVVSVHTIGVKKNIGIANLIS